MRQCPSCERHVPEDHRYCGYCRSELDAAPPPDGASAQREATVLFLDVTNFTAASHSMDSEQVFVWMDETMRLLADVVDRYEGTVNKFTGDGLMAIFGAPAAHENDPERAVCAALEMQKILAPLRARVADQHGFSFQVRIGINTGSMVAGTIGGDLHGEYTVLGDAVNLASRLEKAAEPGTVLVSASTYARTAPLFAYDAQPPLLVKGVAEPLQTYRPLGPAAQPGSLRGIAGLAAPMVGRDADLARLRGLLEAVCADRQRRVAIISGDAGIGKSRLVAELQAAAPPPLRVCRCACLAHTRHSPLYLAGELLRALVGAPARPGDAGPALAAFAAELGLPAEVLPYLQYALGLEQPPAAAQALAALDPAMLQRQLAAAFRQALVAAAEVAPLAMFCDDLHWADAPSRELLRSLLATTADSPLAFVLVSRTAEPDLLPLDAREAVAVGLTSLSADDGRALIDAMLRHPAAETLELARRILERAAGNPLYIEEQIRMLIEQGGLVLAERGWVAAPHAAELLAGVPTGLRNLILARFDRLPSDLRAQLQRLAVVGRAAPVGLLARLDGGDRSAARGRLEQLAARGFLSRAVGADSSYAFLHVLVQDAIYETILRRDRRQLHTLAAEAIVAEGCWSPEERTEALARQYAESATPYLSIPYLIEAAGHAERRFASETAAQHYRQAAALMASHPAGQGRHALSARLGLARALKAMGDLAEAGLVLEEAAERLQASLIERGTWREFGVQLLGELADLRMREGQLERAADHAQAGLALLDRDGAADPAARRMLQYRLASVRLRQGQLAEALAIAKEATRDADGADDPLTLASLYRILAGVLYEQDQLDDAVTYVERSLAIYERLGYAPGTAAAYDNLGSLHYARGRWPAALESLEQALRLRRAIGYMPDQALTLANLGLVHMATGDHARATEALALSRAISARLGEEFGLVRATIGLAHLALIHGVLAEAERHLADASERLDAVGDDEIIQVRWLQALVRARQGDLVAGARLAEEALALARAAGLPEQETESLRALAEIRAEQGELELAEALAAAAEAQCGERGDAYQLSLARLDLGRIRARQPARRVAARLALAQAVEGLSALGASFDLARAREALQLLAEAGAPVS
ncbi:MAG TPA: adenylate/guanylate cyclase domain-containing protein [Chloroflexaceae bacterium]|nr:adenylate/guanylate cyclase domain-containing protein [Chloroflexaceae bacterium]